MGIQKEKILWIDDEFLKNPDKVLQNICENSIELCQ